MFLAFLVPIGIFLRALSLARVPPPVLRRTSYRTRSQFPDSSPHIFPVLLFFFFCFPCLQISLLQLLLLSVSSCLPCFSLPFLLLTSLPLYFPTALSLFLYSVPSSRLLTSVYYFFLAPLICFLIQLWLSVLCLVLFSAPLSYASDLFPRLLGALSSWIFGSVGLSFLRSPILRHCV
jgi:hypothetical protein